MKLSILAGATSQSINVFVQNSTSTTGGGLTGLAFNTSGLTANYSFAGANAASTSITLVTLATLATAWTSGGFKEIDSTLMPGWYRLDLPNAVIAASKGRSVALNLQGAANMAPCPVEIELTGWDNQNATNGGMTALPNAAPGASGGAFIAGTNAATTVNITGNLSGSVGSVTGNVGGNVVGTVASIVSPGNIWDVVNTAALHNVANSTGKQLRSIGVGTTDVIRTATLPGQGGQTSTTILLDAGASSVNQAYQFDVISIISGTDAGDSRVITGYVGATKVATVQRPWTVQPDNTSVFEITPTASVQVASYLSGQDPATLVLDVAQSLHNTAGTIGGDIGLAAAVGSVTSPVNINLAQTLNAARALDAIVDTALTLNDALHSATAGAAGKESVIGLQYLVQTPSTGTTIRTFTLDSSSAPTTRS
jgi:hypothetical protein